MAFIGMIEPDASEGVLAVFVGGFLVGYLAYKYIHYAIH